MSESLLIKTGTVEVTYEIFAHEMEDGVTMFDWYASNDEESDIWFTTPEEAEQAVRRRFGG